MKTPKAQRIGFAIKAAENMDWQQVVLNGGPPCFRLEDSGRFCGRAERWHEHDTHEFVPLAKMLTAIQADAREGMVPAAELRPLLVDLCQWIKRRLQILEYEDTSTRNPSTGGVSPNGFAYSPVPEWELRQKLEAIETLLGENQPAQKEQL